MEIRNLDTFLKVVDEGSFSKAAEKAGYAQSTVTVQVRKLEEELGVQLFDRIGREVFLTEKGQELVPMARKMVYLAEKTSHIGEKEPELRGNLSIVVPDSFTAGILPKIIQGFRELYPEVEIKVKTGDNIVEIERRLYQNEIDVAFVAHTSIYNKKGYNKDVLQKSKFVFVSSKSCKLAEKGTVSLNEIKHTGLILAEQEFSFLNREAESAFLRKNAERVIDIYSSAGALELVKNNCGIAYLPYYLVKDAVEKEELSILKVPEVSLSVWLQIIWLEHKYVSSRAEAFIDWLKECYSLR